MTINDAAAYGLILTQGHGTFGKHPSSTPSMIRFGQMTEDELFVTADAAQAACASRTTSETDPLVILKHSARAIRTQETQLTERSWNMLMNTLTQPKSPALHNAMWPGLVGKGARTPSRRSISTRCSISRPQAEVDGVKFDGVDLFLFDPHVSIDSTDDELKRLPTKSRAKGLSSAHWWRRCGRRPAAARRWAATRSAGASSPRSKACAIGKKLRELGIRKYGVVRIDSAASPAEWAKDPAGNTKTIADTFREACDIAEGTASASRPKAKSAGAACTAGSAMSSCSSW